MGKVLRIQYNRIVGEQLQERCYPSFVELFLLRRMVELQPCLRHEGTLWILELLSVLIPAEYAGYGDLLFEEAAVVVRLGRRFDHHADDFALHFPGGRDAVHLGTVIGTLVLSWPDRLFEVVRTDAHQLALWRQQCQPGSDVERFVGAGRDGEPALIVSDPPE